MPPHVPEELTARLATPLWQPRAGLAELTRQVLREPLDWTAARERLAEQWPWHGAGLGWSLALAVVLAAGAVGGGLWLRRQARRAVGDQPPTGLGSVLWVGLLSAVAERAVPLCLAAAWCAWAGQLAAADQGGELWLGAGTAAGSLLLVGVLLRGLLDPPSPGHPVAPWEPARRRRLSRTVALLAALLVVGSFALGALVDLAAPPPVYWLVRELLALALALVGIGLVAGLGPLPLAGGGGPDLRAPAVVVGGLAIAAVLVGFRDLAEHLLRAVAATLALRPVWWAVTRLVSETLADLETGAKRWSLALRRWVGVRPAESLPGLGWLRFAVGLLCYSGAAVWLVRAWLTPVAAAGLAQRLAAGLTIGSLTLSPTKVVAGLVVMGALLAAVAWLQTGLARLLEQNGRLDVGARAATVTLAGYGAWIAVALVAVSTMGLDLTRLTVVLGALSVGLGFGLQTIVNNFVSGLILLFERPIQVGDWIRVGDAEGYVRQVSVRATEIQTFDLEEVIIPNSELLTKPVTNLTRRDPRGRLIVPVGVAVGTDSALVRELLLAAAAHEDLADDQPGYPVVLFRGLSDGALAFELRCILRDVDRRLAVLSDLNYAIDRAFRERDVEVRSLATAKGFVSSY